MMLTNEQLNAFGARRFNRRDWQPYMGAERFDSGNDPVICEYDLFTLIADKNGFEIYVWGSENGYPLHNSYAKEVNVDEEKMLELFEALVSLFNACSSGRMIESFLTEWDELVIEIERN